ncbi:hypothetical protein PIB30_072815, partial [Stylosanthes scabra]|nr:hypothetical protein [Stylosanthes scabra]
QQVSMDEIINPSQNTNNNNNNNQSQFQRPLAIPVSDKLCSDNFHTWTYQVIQTISDQKLQHHLDKNKIKKIADSLAMVGSPISDSEYTNVILVGLNDDYHPFITLLNTRDPPLLIPELEALLMVEDELIERLKKTDTSMEQENVTQNANANSNSRNKNSDNQQGNWNQSNNWNNNNNNNNAKGNAGNSGKGGRGGRGGKNK